MSKLHNKFFYFNQALVIIDSSFSSFYNVIKNTLFDAEILVLESEIGELEEISLALEEYPYIGSLHIVCNTSPGCLYLGNTCLSLFNLKNYTTKLKDWSVPNILFYGSLNIAAGNVGKKFIQQLYQIIGANISIYSQVSTDEMNWQFNYCLGNFNPDLKVLPFVKKTGMDI